MKKKTGSRFRPCVEQLEAREVPASFAAATVPELIVAIDAANVTAEADTITLAVGKTFTLTAENNNVDGFNGLPVIAAGEDLTIIGRGATIQRSNHSSRFRLFNVAGDATLTLHDLTLQGGWAFAQGGAIRNLGTLHLDGVTVARNTAGGGGLGVNYGQTASGGGIYSSDTLSVTNSRIEANAAIGGDGSDGRNVANVNMGWITTVPATSGGDALGGGIYVTGGSASIRDTTITGNNVTGGDGGDGMTATYYYGGGEYILPGAAGSNARGGGLCCDGGTVSVQGATVTSNQATGGRGGAGVKGKNAGANGAGLGGGIFIAPEDGVALDAFTLTHAAQNKASTADANIFGQYQVID